mgnify:CR=1 FL=1
MFFKKNIKNLNRIQTSQNRDLLNGINLDRNEKVDTFNLKLQNSIKKQLSKNIFNSTPDISSLYNCLSKYLKINSKNIYITQGITEGIFQIIFFMTKKNDEVIIMNETYPMYKIICKLNNIKFKTWDFNEKFQLSFNGLKKKISNKTKIIFLVNPNLPIEYEFSQKLKKKLYEICLKKKILLVYDEAYYNFGSKSEIKNAQMKKNLIVMRTFSKAWGLPGIRLGFMVGDKRLINYISKCRSLVETNGFSYEIAKWALKNKRILNDHIKLVKNGYNFLYKNFNKMNEDFHGGKVTNAILLNLKSKKNCSSLRKYLRQRKIYIRHGFQDPIKNYVRISLCSPDKLKIFLIYYKKWKKRLSF